MDKDQAKYILSSYNGSEADGQEDIFKKALELVVTDTELSEWFLRERKFDEVFIQAFENFAVPPELKEQVIAVLDPKVEIEESELELIGALATIQPPAGLREQILIGMSQTQEPKTIPFPTAKKNIVNFIFPLAAAAVIALGLYLGLGINKTSSDQNLLSALDIPATVIPVLNSGNFMPLDIEETDYLKTVSWTQENALPSPTALPEALVGLPTMGCKTLQIKGYTGALICFSSDEHGPLHLIVVDAANGDESFNDLPSKDFISKGCAECDLSGLSYAQWQAEGKAYLLVSPEQPLDKFTEIF